MGQVLVCFFAVLLCIVNAVVWTVISEMPLMGAAWIGAAVACSLRRSGLARLTSGAALVVGGTAT